MNTTYPILSKIVKDIEPLELSGGKFTSIEAARVVAKKCQKSKHKLKPLDDCAKLLGVEKAFYTMLDKHHVLFIIDGDEASIEILPSEHDVIYNAYQMSSRIWQWWAMGAHLTMMLNCLRKLGSKKFQFNTDFIIGVIDEETICCLTHEEHGHYKLDKLLPLIPPKKVIPPPPKKEEVEESIEEIKETPVKKSRKKKQ